MLVFVGQPFGDVRRKLRELLANRAPVVDVGEWHAMDVSNNPNLVSRELMNITIEIPIDRSVTQWQITMEPNLPWAEDHFDERIGGLPLNPGEEYRNWPWFEGNVDQHRTQGEAFSHTYMERFWPKWAGRDDSSVNLTGIRFPYGDLGDVVIQLIENPMTRQAFLPVFFPEDTGAVHGERVPCTLGYHFIVRNDKLHCVYYLRSCDFIRYFQDDLYLAGRLTQWVWSRIRTVHRDIELGSLTTHITSLHVFTGDIPKMRREIEQDA